MVHTIDLEFMGAPRAIACYLLAGPAGAVLIETGPDTTFPRLKGELERLGHAPESIKAVFLTHIHLDHAGAAWRFAQMGATIYVHPKGAPHLVNPEKLLASASRIYGDQMDSLWGKLEPIAAAQVRELHDGEEVAAAGLKLKALETPGHAIHHHSYLIDNQIFSGDVGGVRIGSGPCIPPFPPPDIDLEAWRASIQKLGALNAEQIYPTHFGGFNDVTGHLEELESYLESWSSWSLAQLKAGIPADAQIGDFSALVAEAIRSRGLGASEQREYELADPAFMSVYGLERYWKKHHPEALGG
jgi:glyoxylase-like metal-dependent hydrolase (beta-lactamase superfamily II)